MVELQNAFEFSDADFAANREGKLTKWQQRRLKEKQSKSLLEPLVVAAFAILVLFTELPSLAKLLFIAFATVFVLRDFRHWQSFSHDLHPSSSVHSLKGWASKRKQLYRDGYRYSLVLAGTSFRINGLQYEALIEGTEYCAYYAPLSQKLLSIEKVEKAVELKNGAI